MHETIHWSEPDSTQWKPKTRVWFLEFVLTDSQRGRHDQRVVYLSIALLKLQGSSSLVTNSNYTNKIADIDFEKREKIEKIEEWRRINWDNEVRVFYIIYQILTDGAHLKPALKSS